MNPYRLHAYLAILAATIIWAVASPVIKFTLGGIDALSFLVYRFAISSVVALVTFILMGVHLSHSPKVLIKLVIYSLFATSISLGLLFFGLEKTTVLEETLILLATPLLISAAGSYFLREHVTTREKVGMGIALVGTLFTVIEPLIQNGTDAGKLSGNIFILLSLVATVIATILAKELLRDGVKPITMTNVSFLVGFISIVPFALVKYGAPNLISTIVALPLPYQLGVFYMALLSGSLAYTLSSLGQKTIEIGEASVFTYLYPIFAAPLAILWLGEKVTPFFILGGAIITIGVIIAEYKKRRYN
jgi:drug/metabolite transporter (DMT)-like permease